MGDVAADTRSAPTLITGDALAIVWPEVSHRLAKLLASRGASRDVADDVIQEVAARVLTHQVSFDGAMDLMRWAVPVALNLLVDNARAAQRVTPVAEDQDQPTADVADLVAHRDRVRRVLGAVTMLSPADRAALATPAEAPADRKEAVRLAVRRHRARRRLLALVDGVAAFTALVAGWLKRGRVTAAPATLAIAALPVALLLVAPGLAPVSQPYTRQTDVSDEPTHPARVRRPVKPAPKAPKVVRPAAPAPAVPAAVPPRRTAPAEPTQVVAVEERVIKVKVQKRESSGDDGLLCVSNDPLVERVCLLPEEHGIKIRH